LEDSLTLDELLEICRGYAEREERQFKAQARLMGAEFPDDDDDEPQREQGQQSSNPSSTLAQIANRAKEQADAEKAKSPKPNFGAGLGYKQI
jgi:hypothetical protein